MTEKGLDASEQLIEQWACQIDRWRLEQPALMFLEIARPLSFVASQGLLLCEPVLGVFCGESRISEYVDFLGDRTKLERLIVRLEQGRAPSESVEEETG